MKQNAAMSLKLFRSTGYSSILSPGETRAAVHPGWVILAASLWTGFACNVGLWRLLAGASSGAGVGHPLLSGALVAAGSATLLSLLGWRTTLKPAATLVLLFAALSACTIWSQALPLDGSAQDVHLTRWLLPPWASLLRWQVSALLVAVAAG